MNEDAKTCANAVIEAKRHLDKTSDVFMFNGPAKRAIENALIELNLATLNAMRILHKND